MKKFSLSIIGLFVMAGGVFAQIENPVVWSYTSKKIDAKTYELHMTAVVQGKWHIYAQDAGEGPEPTAFSFAKNPLVKPDGKIKEVGKLEKHYDPNFKSELKFYSNKVDFVQTVKLKSTAATIVKGTVSYMVCDDRKCLPPKEIPFSIKLGGK
ncbi:MAG: protein-disulfide reductase DsbD domain-containing protein [Ferruginibacter sp.]